MLTERLATRVDDLLAIDVAAAALDRARARDLPDVAFELREVPEEFPDGAYDLIVVSEVLYYLDTPAFDATCDAIERTLRRHPAGRALAPERAALPAHRRRGPRTPDREVRPADVQPPPPEVQPRPLRRMRLLIVGGGPAALATARAYREAGGERRRHAAHAAS